MGHHLIAKNKIVNFIHNTHVEMGCGIGGGGERRGGIGGGGGATVYLLTMRTSLGAMLAPNCFSDMICVWVASSVASCLHVMFLVLPSFSMYPTWD